MNYRKQLATVGLVAGLSGSLIAANAALENVNPWTFDPAKGGMVAASWVKGLGCPVNRAVDNTFDPSLLPTYTDPACATGSDAKDKANEGLLLAKGGPLYNNAAAGAELKNVKGVILTELGYDIREPDYQDARGSHCGAGAPRFNVDTTTGFYFIGCSSPPADVVVLGDGWVRLRWGGAATLMGYNAENGFALEPIAGAVERIDIVYDEGDADDALPDAFGVAILDNIDVNGVLVGRGPNQ